MDTDYSVGAQIAGSRPAPTVITTTRAQAVKKVFGGASMEVGEILIINRSGYITYYNDSLNVYDDVDPISTEEKSIMYVAAEVLNKSECGGIVCTRNVIEQLNYSTGEVTRIYSRITPGLHNTRWHDVDQVGPNRLLVADIAKDRVYLVNTTTDIIEWEWEFSTVFNPPSGGPYGDDWTHLNDVELVNETTVMLSPRNHDQIVFVSMRKGYLPNMTIGCDDCHSVMYEQHNPDFIPSVRGGPAVVIADSQNNRIVEYQRKNGHWKQSWVWEDAQMSWPRDADRLPNGNTLITDTEGNRVLEVNQSGDIVWMAPVATGYEAERLTTGDESAGGRSAVTLELVNRTVGERTIATKKSGLQRVKTRIIGAVKTVMPNKVVNGALYLLPASFGRIQAILLIGIVVEITVWSCIEAVWLLRQWVQVSVKLR